MCPPQPAERPTNSVAYPPVNAHDTGRSATFYIQFIFQYSHVLASYVRFIEECSIIFLSPKDDEVNSPEVLKTVRLQGWLLQHHEKSLDYHHFSD